MSDYWTLKEKKSQIYIYGSSFENILASAFMSPFSQCAQQPLLVTHLTPRIASANRQTEGQKGRVKKLSDRTNLSLLGRGLMWGQIAGWARQSDSWGIRGQIITTVSMTAQHSPRHWVTNYPPSWWQRSRQWKSSVISVHTYLASVHTYPASVHTYPASWGKISAVSETQVALGVWWQTDMKGRGGGTESVELTEICNYQYMYA